MRQVELKKRIGGMQKGDFVSLFSLPSAPEKYFVNISTSLDNKLSRGIDMWSKYCNELESLDILVREEDNSELILEFSDGTQQLHSNIFSIRMARNQATFRFVFDNGTIARTVSAMLYYDNF